MPKVAINSFGRLLVARRNQLLREALMRREASRGLTDSADLIEAAYHSQESEITARLRQTESRLLRAIEEALQRIRRGNFGICANCGERIGRARLKAVPWTRLCLRCKEQNN